jgi:hypothetical protein
MLQRLERLKRLQEVHLSHEEGLALRQRVDSNSCSAADYESVMQVLQASTAVSQQLSQELPGPRSSSPQRKAKRKRPLATASRWRNRREARRASCQRTPRALPPALQAIFRC